MTFENEFRFGKKPTENQPEHTDWEDVCSTLAETITEYQKNPEQSPKPDLANVDLDQWLKWVTEVYQRQVDANDREAQLDLYSQKEDIKAIYRFLISQGNLDHSSKEKLNQLAVKMSENPSTFGFVGTILDDAVIPALSERSLETVFSHALNDILSIPDLWIMWLYGQARDGLVSQQGLWDFEQFRSFLSSLSLEQKKKLVNDVVARILDSQRYGYSKDVRYSPDFSPTISFGRFLSRVLQEEIQKSGAYVELLQSITSNAQESAFSLSRFWDHLFYYTKGNVPVEVVSVYGSYLEAVLKSSQESGSYEVFSLFKAALSNKMLPTQKKKEFTQALTEKYGRERVIEEMFDDDEGEYNKILST